MPQQEKKKRRLFEVLKGFPPFIVEEPEDEVEPPKDLKEEYPQWRIPFAGIGPLPTPPAQAPAEAPKPPPVAPIEEKPYPQTLVSGGTPSGNLLEWVRLMGPKGKQEKPGEAPALPEEKPKAEPGIDPGLILQANRDANEIAAKSKTPEEADAHLNTMFGDQELELQAIKDDIKARIAQLRGPQPVGILDYVTAVLLALGGVNPMQAVEYVTRRGQRALERQGLEKQLLQAQLADISSRRRLAREREQMESRSAMEAQKAAQRAAEQASLEQQRDIGNLLRVRGQLVDQLAFATSEKERKAIQDKIASIGKLVEQLTMRRRGEAGP